MRRRDSFARRALLVIASLLVLGAAASAACIDVDGLASGGDAGGAETGTESSVDGPTTSDVIDAGVPDCGPRFEDCFVTQCPLPGKATSTCASQELSRDDHLPFDVVADDNYLWFNASNTTTEAGVVADGKLVRCSTAADGCQTPGGRFEIATGLVAPFRPRIGIDGIYFTVAASTAPSPPSHVARCKSGPPGCGSSPDQISPDHVGTGSPIAVTPAYAYYFVSETFDGGPTISLYRCSTAGCNGGTPPQRLAAGFRTPIAIEAFYAEGRVVVADFGTGASNDGEIVILDAETGARKAAISATSPAAIAVHPNKAGFIVVTGGAEGGAGAPLSVLWFASRTEPLAAATVMTDPLGYRAVSAIVDDDFVAFSDLSSRVTIARTGPNGPRPGTAPFTYRVLGVDVHSIGANAASVFVVDKGARDLDYRNGRILRLPKK